MQVPNWDKDNAAGRIALQKAGLQVFESPLHLEGGSIHVDGEGCVHRLHGNLGKKKWW